MQRIKIFWEEESGYIHGVDTVTPLWNLELGINIWLEKNPNVEITHFTYGPDGEIVIVYRA